ncbi:MAG: tRNA adenosine(34) deaminase TadA [Clostridia bacterium]|nr:tRNA adenosine(34) deaminase TadA [Clostridia bacterium]
METQRIQDERWMREALALARQAAEQGEIPVGAVIVKDGQMLCGAYNLRENRKSVSAHAELLAIEEACRRIGDWRLTGCTLYVTLEPCPMCAGAIVNGRIDRVVYGVKDPAAGCCGSVLNLNAYPFSHAFALSGGVCAEESRTLLRKFFETKRQNKKESYDQ